MAAPPKATQEVAKKVCGGCSNSYDKMAFSKNQWSSKTDRLCKRCVAGEKPAYIVVPKPVEPVKKKPEPKAKAAPKPKAEPKAAAASKAEAPKATATPPASPASAGKAPAESAPRVVDNTPKTGEKTPELALAKASGTGTLQLEVAVTAGNCKRMDPKAYGVTRRDAWVKLELGGNAVKTNEVNSPTLDPVWEEVFVLNFEKPEQQLKTTFYLGDLQIGMPAEFKLDALVKGKHTYKGMAVMGGKVDLQLRALNFGPDEEVKEDDDSFFSMMG